MEFIYKNTKEELYDFYLYYLKDQKTINKYKLIKKIIMIPIGLILSLTSLYFRWDLIKIHGYLTTQDIAFIFLPIIFGVLWCSIGFLLANTIRKEHFEDILKNIKYDIDEEISIVLDDYGIICKRPEEKTTYKWESIKKVEEKNNCVYIVLKNNRGIIIPDSKFDDENKKEEFFKKCRI